MVLCDAEMFELQDRMSDLMGMVNASTAALVEKLAVAIQSESWAAPGVRSKEHYVSWQTGVSRTRAKRLIAIAERWGELPECEALFRQGRLGEDAMALCARTLRSERDAEVAELAAFMTYEQLQTLVRIQPKPSEPTAEREPETRFFDDDEGRFQLRVTADTDQGALLRKALEAARNDLFHQRHPDTDDDTRPTGVSWHDAMLWMAETTLNALDPEVRRGGRASDRYQVLVHIDRRVAGDPVASLHLGPIVRDTLARYLSCDATVSTIIWDGERLIGINPKERTVNDRLRRIIEKRDGRCRYPGCGHTRWLHVHHLIHWEDGGLTIPENLLCLCPYHHRLHHKGGFTIEGNPQAPDGLKFFNARGQPLQPPPPTPHTGPADQPPAHLGIQAPAFTRPHMEPCGWRSFYWKTIPGCPN